MTLNYHPNTTPLSLPLPILNPFCASEFLFLRSSLGQSPGLPSSLFPHPSASTFSLLSYSLTICVLSCPSLSPGHCSPSLSLSLPLSLSKSLSSSLTFSHPLLPPFHSFLPCLLLSICLHPFHHSHSLVSLCPPCLPLPPDKSSYPFLRPFQNGSLH